MKEEGSVKMRAKHLPQDLEWNPSTGIRLVKEAVIHEPVPASELRSQICHMFLEI